MFGIICYKIGRRALHMKEENKGLGIGVGRPSNETKYREEIQAILNGADERLLYDLYTYAKQKQYKSADYHVSDPDYGDMIIEMVGKMRNEDYLEKIYYYVRAKYRRDSEKTGD